MSRKSRTAEAGSLQQVAATILAAWRAAHGVDRGHATAMVGPEGVVIFIEDAFSPAERAMATSATGEHLLEQYVKALLRQVCAEQQAEVAALTGRAVADSCMSVDPAGAWVMCRFRFRPNPAPS